MPLFTNSCAEPKNQERDQTKTAAKTGDKKAPPLTVEEKEYRRQKQLRALTQVGVRVML